MDFSLTQPMIFPIEMISESEIFTLRYVIPTLMAFPWIVYGLFLLLKWISRFFGPKTDPLTYNPDLAWLYESPPPPERVMTLRELEKLAVDDPRMALRELSRLFRVKYLKPKYRPFSLEYYIKEKETKLFWGKNRWFNLFLESMRDKFTNRYSVIFSEIVALGYSGKNVTTEQVLDLLIRVRNEDWRTNS